MSWLAPRIDPVKQVQSQHAAAAVDPQGGRLLLAFVVNFANVVDSGDDIGGSGNDNGDDELPLTQQLQGTWQRRWRQP